MGRKRVLKIPTSALFICPKCGKNSRIKIPQDNSCIYFYDCKKCKEKISTPPARCCIICSYTDKKCPITLTREFNAQLKR